REINFDGALVSINAVDVSADLKSARVFVSTLGAHGGTSVIDKLEAHRTALQAELSRHVVLKYTPHLIFHLDEPIKRGTPALEIFDDPGQRVAPDESGTRPSKISAASFAIISSSLCSAMFVPMAMHLAANWRSDCHSSNSGKTSASGTKKACSKNIRSCRARNC